MEAQELKKIIAELTQYAALVSDEQVKKWQSSVTMPNGFLSLVRAVQALLHGGSPTA